MSDLILLSITGNQNRPEVTLNPFTGELIFNGRSVIENSTRFFEPIMCWMENYSINPAKKTTLHMKMNYFNTNTSKFLLSICEKLKKIYKSGNLVEIIWYYNDEDMKELGKDYAKLLNIPFKMNDLNIS